MNQTEHMNERLENIRENIDSLIGKELNEEQEERLRDKMYTIFYLLREDVYSKDDVREKYEEVPLDEVLTATSMQINVVIENTK